MNKVILSGRLVKDVQTNYTNGGLTVSRFTVACDRQTKDKASDFPTCIAFGKTAEFVEKYFKKGSGIELEGRIQTGSYDGKDGKKVYTTDVVVDKVEFPKGASAKTSDQGGAKVPTTEEWANIPDGIDDEVPFT